MPTERKKIQNKTYNIYGIREERKQQQQQQIKVKFRVAQNTNLIISVMALLMAMLIENAVIKIPPIFLTSSSLEIFKTKLDQHLSGIL